MDDWEKFNETLPEKEDFHSNLKIEHINNGDCRHAKRVLKDFQIRNLGEYHDLYIQSNTLLLAYVLENLRKIVLKYMILNPGHFLTAPGLTWQVALKRQQ